MSEMKDYALVFLGFLLVLNALFFKDSFIVLLKTAAGLFWLFVLPGGFVMYYWRDKMDFATRLVLGIALSVMVVGLGGYYLGLLGVHIKYHTLIFPPAMILTGIILNRKK